MSLLIGQEPFQKFAVGGGGGWSNGILEFRFGLNLGLRTWSLDQAEQKNSGGFLNWSLTLKTKFVGIFPFQRCFCCWDNITMAQNLFIGQNLILIKEKYKTITKYYCVNTCTLCRFLRWRKTLKHLVWMLTLWLLASIHQEQHSIRNMQGVSSIYVYYICSREPRIKPNRVLSF